MLGKCDTWIRQASLTDGLVGFAQLGDGLHRQVAGPVTAALGEGTRLPLRLLLHLQQTRQVRFVNVKPARSRAKNKQ